MAMLQFLPPENAAKIHESTLQVLENTGVTLDHDEAEAIYLGAGAKKDDDGRVLIPRTMVEEAMEKAHSKIQLYSRDADKSNPRHKWRNLFRTRI